MISKVKGIAQERKIRNPQDLSYEARVTWPTAKNIWEGDISSVEGLTLHKVARALGCKIEDLYEIVDELPETA